MEEENENEKEIKFHVQHGIKADCHQEIGCIDHLGKINKKKSYF